MGIPGLTFYGESRKGDILERHFVEVKGVTLEEDGVVRFPRSPYPARRSPSPGAVPVPCRGLFCPCAFCGADGGRIVLRSQRGTDPDFAAALREAAAQGVEIRAVDCRVTPDTMTIRQEVPVRL